MIAAGSSGSGIGKTHGARNAASEGKSSFDKESWARQPIGEQDAQKRALADESPGMPATVSRLARDW